MLLNLFFIAVIVVFIIDVSGVVDSLKYAIAKFLDIKDYTKVRLKPFDCSLCTNFWASLIYICIFNQFTLVNLLYICILSSLTIQIRDTMILIQDIITKILNTIYDTIQ